MILLYRSSFKKSIFYTVPYPGKRNFFCAVKLIDSLVLSIVEIYLIKYLLFFSFSFSYNDDFLFKFYTFEREDLKILLIVF